jgi:hypothetical protein
MGHLRILILSVIIAISVYAFYMQFYCHQVTSRYQRYPLTDIEIFPKYIVNERLETDWGISKIKWYY